MVRLEQLATISLLLPRLVEPCEFDKFFSSLHKETSFKVAYRVSYEHSFSLGFPPTTRKIDFLEGYFKPHSSPPHPFRGEIYDDRDYCAKLSMITLSSLERKPLQIAPEVQIRQKFIEAVRSYFPDSEVKLFER